MHSKNVGCPDSAIKTLKYDSEVLKNKYFLIVGFQIMLVKKIFCSLTYKNANFQLLYNGILYKELFLLRPQTRQSCLTR